MRVRLDLYTLIALIGSLGIAQAKTCVPMDDYVEAKVYRPTGLGHCDGEATAYFTNKHDSSSIACYYSFADSNTGKKEEGMTVIKPGKTNGGEGGGVFSCHATPEVSYRCYLNTGDYCR